LSFKSEFSTEKGEFRTNNKKERIFGRTSASQLDKKSIHEVVLGGTSS
jgi:hypothetical protein